MEPSTQLEAGTEVGLYRLIEQLGRGGMATVFKARHTVLKRDAALKFLHPAFLEDPEFVRRFRHEARLIAGLEHPNIVPVFDFAEYDGLPYLAMKFIRGITLKARLSAGRVSRKEACRIANAVGQGLDYAHAQGILHRDVKPSNILMEEDGGIYLADFGIARIAASAQSTLSSEMLIGTPQYMSPEQARSEPDLDERTDIYALGIVLYELIVGEVPFDADTPISIIHDHLHTPPTPPSKLAEDVPEAMERVILTALAKKKEDRFNTAGALIKAFLEAAGAPEAASYPDLPRTPSMAETRTKAPSETEAEQAVQATSTAASLISAGGLAFPLLGERLLIGREDLKRGVSPDIDLTAAEPEVGETGKRRRTVHREQAWVVWKDKHWGVKVIAEKEDRAWMNGDPMEAGHRYVLREGDLLKFGAVELNFHIQESAEKKEGEG